MPIAFDNPTHAPHGTLPTRGTRAVDDDPATLDIFTQLLLAAAGVQDAAAPLDATSQAPQADARPTDASLLALPLPLPVPLSAGAATSPRTVTIVASEKIADVRAVAATDARGVLESAARAAATPAVPSLAPLRATTTTHDAGTPTLPLTDREATLAPAPGASLPVTPVPSASAAPPDAAPPRDGAPVRAAGAPRDPGATLVALLAPAAQVPDKATAAKTAKDLVLAPMQALVAPAPLPATPVHIETVAAPAFTPGWQDETVNKLAQIVLTRTERAELRLHPAELGPVNVRIEMNADQASVQIVAASPETRTALEQSLPQLRDLLASQGITLGQATVHDGSAQRDARAGDWATSAGTRNDNDRAAAGDADTVRMIVRRPDRLVDVFA